MALGGTSDETGPKTTKSDKRTFALNVVDDSSELFHVLKALRQDRLIKVLAEPILVTQSGRAASFHSGGEIPTLVPQGKGTVSVEYKKYGTMIDFIPVVLDNETVHLEIRASISELDHKHSIRVAENTVPAIRTVSMDTACNIKTGHVMVLSGLRQRRTVETPDAADEKENKKASGALQAKTKPAFEEIALLVLLKPELIQPMEAIRK